MTLLYRVENLITNRGLWYNSEDQSASGVVTDLKLSNMMLPMDPTELLSNESWKSAAESLEQLAFWFNKEDLNKLIPLGFNLYEIDSTFVSQHTTEFYSHPIFQEQGVVSRKLLDINKLI